MTKRERERVQIGTDAAGKPVYSWVEGKNRQDFLIKAAQTLLAYGMLDGCKPEQQEKAKSTTRQMSILLHQVFDMAVKDGYMRTNPTESKRLSMSGCKKKREALSMREVQDILQSLDRLLPQERMTVALLLLTGMRRGKALGLCWEHIDWDRKLIHVEQAVTFLNNQPVLGDTKSEAGNRTIPLDTQLGAILLPERKERGFVPGVGEKPPDGAHLHAPVAADWQEDRPA